MRDTYVIEHESGEPYHGFTLRLQTEKGEAQVWIGIDIAPAIIKDLVAAHAKSIEALRDYNSQRATILERTLLARDSLMDDMAKLIELASRIHAGDRDALGEVIAIGKRRSGMVDFKP